MKGIDPMAILKGFPLSNTISPDTRINIEEESMWPIDDTDAKVCKEIVADDPQAGPGQDAEWDTGNYTMVHDERDYGDGRNISFRKRSGDVLPANGEEIQAETAESHNV